MDLQLSHQTAIVTGGASGIGWATVRLLLEEGAQVMIWDRARVRDDQKKMLTDEQAHRLSEVYVDITDHAQVIDAVDATKKRFGSIHHLIHAAAIGSGKFGFPFTNLVPDDWRKSLEVNIMGVVEVCHAVAPELQKQKTGSICILGSVAGQIGSQTDPPYSACKAANINFAQCMAKDLAPHGVRVNVVNPGMVQTPLNRSVWQAWNDQQSEENRRSYEDWADEKVRKVVPLGRWQTPEDIANTIVFLASNRARNITGQCVNVDGGFVMHW